MRFNLARVAEVEAVLRPRLRISQGIQLESAHTGADEKDGKHWGKVHSIDAHLKHSGKLLGHWRLRVEVVVRLKKCDAEVDGEVLSAKVHRALDGRRHGRVNSSEGAVGRRAHRNRSRAHGGEAAIHSR